MNESEVLQDLLKEVEASKRLTVTNKDDNDKIVKRLEGEIEDLKRSNDSLSRTLNAFITQTMPLNRINDFEIPSESDVLSLNVGGTKMEVLRRTLTSIPSLLETKFSGQWDKNLPKDSKNRFLLEEEPEIFIALINYLRDHNRMLPSGSQCPKLPSFATDDKSQKFIRMVEDYDLAYHCWPFDMLRFGPQGVLSTVKNSMHTRIVQQEGCSYYMLQRKRPDNRRVHSFETQVHLTDNCVWIKIGWMKYGIDKVTGAMSQGSEIYLDVYESMIATIDMESDGPWPTELEAKINVPEAANLTIRCANRGAEWYINGELVAETTGRMSALSSGEQDGEFGWHPFMCFEGTMSFRLIQMELEYIE
ncbi:hypothetical protein MPSEU_000092500 [Mayamaea pseudoterrestris]|nr:hypothetical protein MPSEU_000092500 [Mayamaea pseudoterrestris]